MTISCISNYVEIPNHAARQLHSVIANVNAVFSQNSTGLCGIIVNEDNSESSSMLNYLLSDVAVGRRSLPSTNVDISPFTSLILTELSIIDIHCCSALIII